MEPAHFRGPHSLDGSRNWRQRQHQQPQVMQTEYSPRNPPSRSLSSSVWASSPRSGFDPRGWQWRATDYSAVPPSPAQIEVLNSFGNGDLSERYAYFLDRGQGRVTRLIPADALPPLNEIPALENRGQGMEILPFLRGTPPQGSVSMNQRVTFQAQNNLLVSGCPGPTPPSNQKQHDRPGMTSPHVPKKNKVYCDKWVHEGICAFTQQGCRFKHEMPQDKATQQSLGLFHGLPAWWKKRQAERQADMQRQQMVQDTGLVSPTSKSVLAGSVPDTPTSQEWEAEDKVGNKRFRQRPVSTNGALSPRGYPLGPIAPPRKLTH